MLNIVKRYKKVNWNSNLVQEFEIPRLFEAETKPILLNNRPDIDRTELFDFKFNNFILGYITDIHLMHHIEKKKHKRYKDILKQIYLTVDTIINESYDINLIGGDISSDYNIFELFIKILNKKNIHKKLYIFVLGNHEFWNFPDKSIEETAEIYRKLLNNNNMLLLHNELLCVDRIHKKVISYNDLINHSSDDLANLIRTSQCVILGGTGFSGYNKEFNADNGIYLSSINREEEIAETAKFETIFNKLKFILSHNNSIVFTHMPKDDWLVEKEDVPNILFVSGHTHKNEFYDDGIIRIYRDNQIGYNGTIHMKNFFLDKCHDYFFDYNDGIHIITPQEYKDFMRAKNIMMNFNRDTEIYMLKKIGYYCFIIKNKKGKLLILNGGMPKTLKYNDINYYFNHMDEMINTIKSPLDKYTLYQEKISEEVKAIGGTGKIHGCIVDIDYFNHVYVNPFDLTVHYYWALDMINKILYPNLELMLEERNPILFLEYKKNNNVSVLHQTHEIIQQPIQYFDTDIYSASKEIKKMQRLHSNILSNWYDLEEDNKNKLSNS